MRKLSRAAFNRMSEGEVREVFREIVTESLSQDPAAEVSLPALRLKLLRLNWTFGPGTALDETVRASGFNVLDKNNTQVVTW